MKNPSASRPTCRFIPATAIALVATIAASSALADEALFIKQCGVCHTLNPDDPPRQGPHLSNLLGRQAGSVDEFPYSGSLGSLDLVWDGDNLDQWIADPQSLAGDSYMIYKQDDPVIRKAIVDYLSSL